MLWCLENSRVKKYLCPVVLPQVRRVERSLTVQWWSRLGWSKIPPWCSSILSLSCWRNASAGNLALSRTIVVRIKLLLLSVISKFLSLSFLATQDNALWQVVLGEVVILPMMFQIGLHEYSSWLFLYIVDSWVLRNLAMGQQFSHAQKCVMFCALLKDQKMPDLSKFAWDICLVCE